MAKPIKSPEWHWKMRRILCAECLAPVGMPCVSLRPLDRGKPIQHYHISRTLGRRTSSTRATPK